MGVGFAQCVCLAKSPLDKEGGWGAAPREAPMPTSMLHRVASRRFGQGAARPTREAETRNRRKIDLTPISAVTPISASEVRARGLARLEG